MSLELISLPRPPRDFKLFDGTPDEWHDHQRELARAEGYAAAVQDAALRLDAATAQLEIDRAQAIQELPAFALRFAQEVARHLLRTTIQAGEHDIEGMIRDALARSGAGRGACEVHVHPDDLAQLDGVVFRNGTEVLGDPTLPAGTVHVSTPQGLLVRDIDSCVRAAAEEIYKTMPGHKTPLPVVKPVPPAIPPGMDTQNIAEVRIPGGTPKNHGELIAPELIAPDLNEDTIVNQVDDFGPDEGPRADQSTQEDPGDA